MLSKTGRVSYNSSPRSFHDGKVTFILELYVTRERVECEWVFPVLPVRHNGRAVNSCKEAHLALIISMASSKLSTVMIGRIGPKISLRPDFRMVNMR